MKQPARPSTRTAPPATRTRNANQLSNNRCPIRKIHQHARILRSSWRKQEASPETYSDQSPSQGHSDSSPSQPLSDSQPDWSQSQISHIRQSSVSLLSSLPDAQERPQGVAVVGMTRNKEEFIYLVRSGGEEKLVSRRTLLRQNPQALIAFYEQHLTL